MNRRTTYRPPAARRLAYREHIAAALGCTIGMLAVALLVIAIEVTR